MAELVSVLIPAYNAEPWLRATIRSSLTQAWPNIEVIVVDDGSKDGTLAVAKSLQGPSVKVVTQPNQGAAARNKALELAQGRYIQWLDDDDVLHSQKIAAQMRAAEAATDRRIIFLGSIWDILLPYGEGEVRGILSVARFNSARLSSYAFQ